MTQTRREIQVGITVIIAFVVLIIGMLWFKQYRFSGGVKHYAAEFHGVEGLQTRDRVQVRGIRMGAVDAFRIVDDKVRVFFHVDPQADLREDAAVSLQSIGIVGEMVVDINPGTGKSVPEGHIFEGRLAGSLTEVTDIAGEALQELRDLSSDLRSLLADIRADHKVTGALTATREAAVGVSGIVDDNRQNIRTLVGNLTETSAALRTALAGPDSALTVAARGAARSLSRSDSLLTDLEDLTSSLRTIVSRMEAGEGTLGLLLQDESLYQRVDSTLAAVEEFLDDVRRNPRKYFKFSVIDF
jgi:phospholipid/cholesterol/gamma-HCH transport system substrate-binding protein